MACVRADFHHGTGHLIQQRKEELVTDEMKHDGFWHFQCPVCEYARDANATMFQLKALAKPLWCGACRASRPTKQWTCECGEPWYLCQRHGKPPAKKPKQVRSTHPKPEFMDDATEQLLLRKLDTVKCTPKYSQASALGARRSLRAMLGAKGRIERKASGTSRASTATF